MCFGTCGLGSIIDTQLCVNQEIETQLISSLAALPQNVNKNLTFDILTSTQSVVKSGELGSSLLAASDGWRDQSSIQGIVCAFGWSTAFDL
jgi:hypothetical protein